MNLILQKILSFLYPPRCVACGRLLPNCFPFVDLCDDCDDRWQMEKRIEIREVKTGKSSPIQVITVAPYDTRKHAVGVGKAVVLGLKSFPDKAAADFVARQMLGGISWLYLPSDTVITWVPRSRKGMTENGFDQGRLIAERLSRYTGMKTDRFLIHKGNAVQKKLHRRERIANARKSYGIYPRGAHKIKDASILLIDDVLTSGATMEACAKRLIGAGAKRVFCLAFAGKSKNNRSI